MKEQLEKLRERVRKIAPKVGFPLFYVFCLVLFSSWTFPYGKLKDRIVVSFNAQQRASGSPQELAIDEITSSWLTGVKMTGVHLTGAPSEPGKPPSELKIDRATARIALLPLLVGNRDVTFGISAWGGTVDGSYDDRGTSSSFETSIDGLDVGQLTPLTDLLGLPMEGSLSGTVKLDLAEGKAAKTSGAVALEIHDLAVGDGKAKLKGLLALPRVNIGTLSLAADAKDGVLRVTKFGSGGKDVELAGDGRIQLRETAGDSGLDVNVRFKINDAYRTKSEATKALFGAPGSNAPAAFEFADPRIKQAKRPDGFYAWHVRGQLARPDFAPMAVATPTPGAGFGNFGAVSAPPGAGVRPN